MRRTKIVCTLGPATDQEGVLESLVQEGMNVARFNFSHGTHEEQTARFNVLKEIRDRLDVPVAALLDTKGPEIRLLNFVDGKVDLKMGQDFFLTTDEIDGTAEGAAVTYAGLPTDVKEGDTILIDDGLVGLTVNEVKANKVFCTVQNSGTISNHKGINLPGIVTSMPFISDKDRADILYGIEEGFDFVAASFTRTAEDVLEMRKLLDDYGGKDIDIIAKIENQQGVDNIDAILAVSDGVMIARGDMGVEIPLEEVPIIQKAMIFKAYHTGKPVITATQMLDSMIKNPRPTRAETTDVANAIYEGTSAIMLSGETAAGLYPVQALKTMVRIARRIEADIDYVERFHEESKEGRKDITMAISHATCVTAIDLGARAIITVSRSGLTARMISRFRPDSLLVGCTPYLRTWRKLALSWGVQPVMMKEEYSMEILFLRAIEAAEYKDYIRKGDVVVLTAGMPIGQPGNTNLLKAEVVGD